ncbi:alpha/beta hydrolase [Amycolatopsis sp. NPDC058278]|uniref:alpha/beta hydrolase n=1 Tax=Amycolatopsis sp. NPDC058278 TaxID=3346417 RepID=UPI0036D9FB05
MVADPVEITFDSHGTECVGSLYLPSTTTRGVPCVVMGNGLGATRDLILPAYATRFAAGGFAALTFDYRHFGASGGTPRQLLHTAHQQEDFRAAVRFARTLPGVDPQRIALWGLSFGGLHVMTIGATDPSIAAVVALTPGLFVSRPALSMLAKLVTTGVADAIRMLRGREPRRRPIIGDREEGALMSNAQTERAMHSMTKDAPLWRNEISFARVFTLPMPRNPGRLTMPLLMCLADEDRVTSPSAGRCAARKAPRGEIRHYPAGHVDIHVDPVRGQVIADQLNFFRTHLHP